MEYATKRINWKCTVYDTSIRYTICITMGILPMLKLNNMWKFEDEHVIDGMIYANDIEKWVTVEEYTEYHYGTH